MSKEKRHFSGTEKVRILRRQLVEKEAVSKVCEEEGLSPVQFYRWQKELFENGWELFEGGRGRRRSERSKEAERISHLEVKLRQKDEVLAEVMGEYVALKKSFGEN